MLRWALLMGSRLSSTSTTSCATTLPMPTPNPKPIRLLISRPYLGDAILKFLDRYSDRVDYLLDSGAFTYHKQKRETSVEDYIQFVKSLPVKPWGYFQLDVIFDAQRTADNLAKMLDAGLKPIPIFTRGDDFSRLETMYEASDVVGVGGLAGAGHKRSQRLAFLDRFTRQVAGRKIHWLGVMSGNLLAKYRPYSCDGTIRNASLRYGQTSVYMGRGQMLKWGRDERASKPSTEVLQRIRHYGIDPYMLAKEKNWRGGVSLSHMLSMRSWHDYVQDLEKHAGIYAWFATPNYPHDMVNFMEWLETCHQ